MHGGQGRALTRERCVLLGALGAGPKRNNKRARATEEQTFSVFANRKLTCAGFMPYRADRPLCVNPVIAVNGGIAAVVFLSAAICVRLLLRLFCTANLLGV